jgi:diguanylate cyclase (GGDEF)-like protein
MALPRRPNYSDFLRALASRVAGGPTASIRHRLDALLALSILPAAALAGAALFAACRESAGTAQSSLFTAPQALVVGLMLACSWASSIWLARWLAASAAAAEARSQEWAAERNRINAAEAMASAAAQRLKELQHQASHDELTGLANRRWFDGALRQRVDACAFDGTELTLLYIDIDGFKKINDKHGHVTGDQLLRLFAARLRSSLRETDVIARLGGDEFAVILGHAAAAQALRTADALIDQLAQPYRIGNLLLDISASIGLVACVDSGQSAPALLAAADAAMYQAKQAGRCRHVSSGFAHL